jgi:hypothetical protein
MALLIWAALGLLPLLFSSPTLNANPSIYVRPTSTQFKPAPIWCEGTPKATRDGLGYWFQLNSGMGRNSRNRSETNPVRSRLP